MSFPLILRRIAEQEFFDAIAWYEGEREGLGLEFRAEIENCFERISNTPELFPKVLGETRRAMIHKRFPYIIHFLLQKNRIVILSVFHTSRDPSRLKNR